MLLLAVVVVVITAGLFTVIVMRSDVLAVKSVDPLYVAVKVWLPAPSDDSSSLAVCTVPTRARVAVPAVVAPSLKVTVPVGFAVPLAGLTTALSFAVPPMPTLGVLVDSLVLVGAAADAGPVAMNIDAATTPAPSRASQRRRA